MIFILAPETFFEFVGGYTLNNITTLIAWAQIVSIFLAMAAILTPIWLYLHGKLQDPLRRRRSIGVFLYGLSALLAVAFVSNRNAPVNTLLDVLGWIVIFLCISFLIWLLSIPLVFRFLEKRSEYPGTVSPTEK